MRACGLRHLADETVLHGFVALVTRDRRITAMLLAYLGEVDDRRLYVREGYPSMYVYCVQGLGMSEPAAYRRIHAARTARRFPAIFAALTDGRLHLTAVGLLAPYLTERNAGELLVAAERRTKAELEVLLAERFPKLEMLSWVADLETRPAAGTAGEAAERGELGSRRGPEGAGTDPVRTATAAGSQLCPDRVGTAEPGPIAARADAGLCSDGIEREPRPPGVTAIGPRRFALQVSIDATTRDKLEHAKALLGHQLPSGDLAEVLDRALDALIAKLEKRKFAATERPQRKPRQARNARTIPAQVRRAVWKRDGGRCTFVSDTGTRCPSRTMLEFDHVTPVARGGEATIGGVRLRCRAHNQYEAERAFGTAFMRAKREAARAEHDAGCGIGRRDGCPSNREPARPGGLRAGGSP